MMRIGIIGGGASGVFLAKLLEKDKDEVVIFEKNNSLLKKVRMTGNGRGNVSNNNMDKHFYNHPDFCAPLISKLNINQLSSKLNCLLKSDDEGRIYPYFEKTQIVVDGLSLDKTSVRLNTEVNNINIVGDKYFINNEEFDSVVIATGSEAPNGLFSDNNKKLIKALDHNITNLYPSLSILFVNDNLKKISGKRVKGNISLILNDEKYQTNGEILFKDDSLSGIAVFELSSIYARKCVKKEKFDKAYLELDLFSDIDEQDLFTLLLNRFKQSKEPLKGLFDQEFIDYLKNKVDVKNIKNLSHYLKHMVFNINLNKTANIYQVVSGGVDINEINNDLSSKKHKGLYFMGEVLDIDGICGGYNLHFAFSSAYRVYNSLKGRK